MTSASASTAHLHLWSWIEASVTIGFPLVFLLFAFFIFKPEHVDHHPNRVYIGGQSSGGHLAAVALTTDWQRDFDLPPDVIKGGLCISGMYDLAPVRLSARSRYVALDDASVAALSPIRHLDRLSASLVVAYGTCETPEFQRQNCEFATAVEAAGKRVKLLVGEHYNHFELPETLGNPYGPLGRAALDLMGLTAGETR